MHETLIKKIDELAEDIAQYYGCYIVGVTFISASGKSGVILRVYVDGEGGVNISQLTDISRELSMMLDIKDLIDFKYTLEVSSPGIDRVIFKLRDYEKYKGKRVKISVKNKINGRLNFIGKIIDLADDINSGEFSDINIEIFDEIENKNYFIPFIQIKKANLIA